MLRSITNMPRLPLRPREGHKGTFGKVLIVAGSVGMSGAAVLAGLGALRGGAGLVRIATPASIQPIVAAGHPCYMSVPLPADAQGTLSSEAQAPLLQLCSTATVVAYGPGLGQNDAVVGLLESVLQNYQGPVVIDADGLHALGRILEKNGPIQRQAPVIATPHPGEFGRLMNLSGSLVQAERKPLAVRFATERHMILALKGHGTVVTDGQRVYVNTTGNPGMAKGGSGDVLTGLIASLVAQGMPALEATQLGVHLHGLAGDIAAGSLGEHAMLPTDLLDALPAAFKKYGG